MVAILLGYSDLRVMGLGKTPLPGKVASQGYQTPAGPSNPTCGSEVLSQKQRQKVFLPCRQMFPLTTHSHEMWLQPHGIDKLLITLLP